MVVLYTGWMVDRVSDEWLYCTLIGWWLESRMRVVLYTGWMVVRVSDEWLYCTLVGWWIESRMSGCTVHWLVGG